MTNITNIITAAVSEKPNQTYDAFSAAIESKLVSALQAKYDSVSSAIFNKTTDTEEAGDNDEG